MKQAFARPARALPPGLAIFLLLAISVLISAAPSMAAGRLEFKRIVGISWATFSEPPSPVAIPEAGFSLARQTGLVFGGGGVLRLGPYFSIDLNLQYLGKGAKVDHTFMGEHVGKSTYDFKSFSVPLCVRFGLLRGSTPYLLTGLETSYLLGHNVVFFPDGSESGTATKLGSVVRHVDFAAVLGGGFEVVFKNWTCFAELRYYSGLVNLSQGVDAYPVIKTRTLSLQFGFRTHRAPFPF